MISPLELRRLNARAAAKAAQASAQPFRFWDAEELAAFPVGAFSLVPRRPARGPTGAWRLVDEVLIDVSGLGLDAELALTAGRLKAWIQGHLARGNPYGYGIVEVGEFQAVLGVFERGP